MPKPVSASRTVRTAMATERAGEAAAGSMGWMGGMVGSSGFGHPVGTWSGITRVVTSRDGLSRQDRRFPYSSQSDLVPERTRQPWPNAPDWETFFAP